MDLSTSTVLVSGANRALAAELLERGATVHDNASRQAPAAGVSAICPQLP